MGAVAAVARWRRRWPGDRPAPTGDRYMIPRGAGPTLACVLEGHDPAPAAPLVGGGEGARVLCPSRAFTCRILFSRSPRSVSS